ncbi:MAG: glyoxalase/bleomycin resistance/extradiol dioxygenase family protein [Alphaproteobacteria bacterium CG_4_10_14_0_2_um_filter_63_37]|nr:MAG: glyoxalase [Proteobacteria bacterium CG1_02_64_396]PJA26027.1 MAG: glyoxalase/bleomycin resistance/extradiol dioxygenase family protein [Alphaproteobacteria bacterium CG_4_10_14_0_2_um_filter_63_37]
MLDHVGFPVANLKRSRDFYTKALAPLGVEVVLEGDRWVLLGRDGKGELLLGLQGHPPGSIHLAFRAQTREQVRQFYLAALASGGREEGVPGMRSQHLSNYYGAFVLDPDGHRIEVVCHTPSEL